MAITTTWKIDNMTHNTVDGGVTIVYWSCTAKNDVTPIPIEDGGGVSGGETAVEAGKLRLEPNPSSGDFIDYDSLTEATVLGWVYNSLKEGEETAEEAKTRIETNRTGKVEAQIARNSANAQGVPWATEEV